jgi:hypothetical protein
MKANGMKTITQLQEQIQQLDASIDAIKTKLLQLGPMQPGVLTRQYQKPKEKKAPYWQLSYTHRQRSYTVYIRESIRSQILQEIQNYQTYQQLTQQWTDLVVERAQRSIQLIRLTVPKRTPGRKSKDKSDSASKGSH